MTRYPYIAILGPTASGKSNLALQLADKLNGEIVCCDSVQLYKELNIGSNKPTREEQQQIRHHMLDLIDANTSFDAFQYAEKTKIIIQSIYSQNKIPVVVVGTGLYFRALEGDRFDALPNDQKLREQLNHKTTEELQQTLKLLSPKRYQEIHPHDRIRLIRAVEIVTLNKQSTNKIKISAFPACFKIRLNPPKKELHKNIANRVNYMLQAGWIEEVKTLLKKGYNPHSKPLQSIGYRQIVDFLQGRLGKAELVEKITIATRQYAKRQNTWFKKTEPNIVLSNNIQLSKLIQSCLSAIQKAKS